jgi:hypothetical protein
LIFLNNEVLDPRFVSLCKHLKDGTRQVFELTVVNFPTRSFIFILIKFFDFFALFDISLLSLNFFLQLLKLFGLDHALSSSHGFSESKLAVQLYRMVLSSVV